MSSVLAGVTSSAVLNPLDIVKTRIQVKYNVYIARVLYNKHNIQVSVGDYAFVI